VYKFSYILSLILSFVLLTPSNAQNEDTIFPDSWTKELKISLFYNYNFNIALQPTNETSDFEDVKKEPDSIFLHRGLDYKRGISPTFNDYWARYYQTNNIYITKYKGLHKLIHRHLFRVINKYYKRELRKFWSNSYLNLIDLDTQVQQYHLEASDSEYHWWERSWMQSFPIEKGGARVLTNTIGHSHDVYSIGPISIKNTGKVSWSGWRLTVSHERDETERDKINRDIRTSYDNERYIDPSNPTRDAKKRDFVFGISPPKGNLYSGKNWTVSGMLRMNIRIKKIRKNSSSVAGSIRFRGYFHNIRWISAELEAITKPFVNEHSLMLSIVIPL